MSRIKAPPRKRTTKKTVPTKSSSNSIVPKSADFARVFPFSAFARSHEFHAIVIHIAVTANAGEVTRLVLNAAAASLATRGFFAANLGIENFPADLMVNRVVLLDVARQIASGRPDPLAPGFEITGAHLEQTAKAQGVEVRKGDSVMIRTGWGQYFAKDNAKYLGEQSPGPGQDGARWIIDKGVRLAGDDTATFEKRPAAYGKELFSVHMMLLADSGIYIVENCNLEALADAKAYVALLILTPLRIQGATGSPLRAIALAP